MSFTAAGAIACQPNILEWVQAQTPKHKPSLESGASEDASKSDVYYTKGSIIIIDGVKTILVNDVVFGHIPLFRYEYVSEGECDVFVSYWAIGQMYIVKYSF